jgi:hypothetical protein
MDPRDVGAQVASDQDCASPVGQLGAEPIETEDVESAEDFLIGQAVEGVVTRQKSCGIRGEGGPGRVD